MQMLKERRDECVVVTLLCEVDLKKYRQIRKSRKF